MLDQVLGAGRAYLATYLKPKDVASLETKSDFPHDLVVRFLVYQITDKIELKGCCDDIKNCPYVTKSITPSNYKQWMQGSFLCKGGTKKVSTYLTLLHSYFCLFLYIFCMCLV